jgi:hypothetical protein
MIPTSDDLRILFEGKPEEYFNFYREELYDILASDENDNPVGADGFGDIESLDTEELFEVLFTIPMTDDDDYCEVINILADEYLSYDVDAGFENDELVVYVNESKYIIDSRDGYSIIKKFDEIIRPSFETRVMKLSLDEDNVHSLIILRSITWENMEKKYGKKVSAYFEKIDNVNFY